MDELTPQHGPYGGRVDDAIAQDLFPTGEPGGLMMGNPQGGDQLRAAQASLEIVERHLEPVTTAQLGALMLLRQEGGPFAEMAQYWEDNHHRRGSAHTLIEAISGLSLIRNFRGVSVMKGGQPNPGGGRR